MTAVALMEPLSVAGELALAHARAGRPVFPCGPDKRPAVPKSEGGAGFKDATTDEAQIRAWWARWPEALIGMPTGAVTGTFVVDIDVKAGKQGEESWRALTRAFGPVPDSWETITATGGRHLWFAHPGRGLVVPNRASRLGRGDETWGRGAYPAVPFARANGQLVVPDVDIRGDGGYVILPGSCVRRGQAEHWYCWEGSSDPDEGVPLAVAPDWLLALVTTVTTPTTATPGRGVAGQFPAAAALGDAGGAKGGEAAPVAEGGRNDFLFRLGRGLRAKGLSEAAILAALLAENAARCLPPLAEHEVQATAASVASKAPGTSEQRPEWLRERTPVDAAAGPGDLAAMPEPRPEPPPWETALPEGGGGGKRRRPELKVVAGTDHDPRPVLRVTAGRLAETVDALEELLLAAGAEIYQQGTRLVRIGQWEPTGGAVERPQGAAVLIDVTATWLVDHATRRVRFERFDGRVKEWVAMDCPPKVAESLLSRSGSWRFPHLLGFVDAPTLLPSGRVVQAAGYDAESQLFVHQPPEMAPLGQVSQEDVAAASRFLYALFDTFPFVSDADAAALLAMGMTALLRRVLPAAPIGCISASTPGTGKSLLADCVSMLATGRTAAVAAIGKDAEELEKRVDALLLKGDAICSFDNIDRAVKSDVLCQVTTQGFKSVRVLGLSRMVEAPTNITLLMTGNNLTLLGDLVRRTVLCNLDAGMERPELREFERNAVAHVAQRRGQGVRAALTIAKGYLDAGCPRMTDAQGRRVPPFGSFELWDRLVRLPLMWAGWPDPLQPAEGMREQDHEFAGMVDFMQALLEASGGNAMTAAEIINLMRERQPSYADHEGFRWPELHEAGEAVFGADKTWDASLLGRRFRAWKRRILGGLRLNEAPGLGRRGGRYWRVERARGDGD